MGICSSSCDHTSINICNLGTWGDVVGFVDFLAKAIDIEFAFHLGDLSYGTSEEVWNKYPICFLNDLLSLILMDVFLSHRRWGRLVEPVAARIPYLVLPGNWDAKVS